MALLKLNLVKRKVLLFVNSIEAGFRLRLFLESFGLRSASINAELPLNSRHHILQVRQVRGIVREGLWKEGGGVKSVLVVGFLGWEI